MKFELIRGSHSFGEANYHMQFTPAYRQDVFSDELTKLLVRDYIIAASQKHGITIAAIGFGPDHCHVFTEACKNHSPAQVAKLLKGFSSRMMRKHHRGLFRGKLYGKKFWSGGYFYRTVGAVNAGTVRLYVEQAQQKHWKQGGVQRKLIEFGANLALNPRHFSGGLVFSLWPLEAIILKGGRNGRFICMVDCICCDWLCHGLFLWVVRLSRSA